MQRPYLYYYGGAGPAGPSPGKNWNELANQLRSANLLHAAGSMVGNMVAAEGFNTESMIRAAGSNFANEVQPPLSRDEHAEFMGGIEEVVAVNALIGERR